MIDTFKAFRSYADNAWFLQHRGSHLMSHCLHCSVKTSITGMTQSTVHQFADTIHFRAKSQN